jgi:hypothetical protein
MRHHRRVETVFSQLDRLGLSHKVHVSTTGLYLHILAVLLAYCVLTFIRDYPSVLLVALSCLYLFPNLGFNRFYCFSHESIYSSSISIL